MFIISNDVFIIIVLLQIFASYVNTNETYNKNYDTIIPIGKTKRNEPQTMTNDEENVQLCLHKVEQQIVDSCFHKYGLGNAVSHSKNNTDEDYANDDDDDDDDDDDYYDDDDDDIESIRNYSEPELQRIGKQVGN